MLNHNIKRSDAIKYTKSIALNKNKLETLKELNKYKISEIFLMILENIEYINNRGEAINNIKKYNLYDIINKEVKL